MSIEGGKLIIGTEYDVLVHVKKGKLIFKPDCPEDPYDTSEDFAYEKLEFYGWDLSFHTFGMSQNAIVENELEQYYVVDFAVKKETEQIFNIRTLKEFLTEKDPEQLEILLELIEEKESKKKVKAQIQPNKRMKIVLDKAGKLALKKLVLFNVSLPYYIQLPLGLSLYQVTDINLPVNKPRLLIIAHDKIWARGENIHGDDVISINVGNGGQLEYTSEVSLLEIGLELLDGDSIAFKHDELSLLLQNIMFSLKNKLIEIKGISIDANTNAFGAMECFMVEQIKGQPAYNVSGPLLTPFYGYKKEIELPTGNLLDTDKHTPAVLFAHKCEIAYHNYENYDCVLYAAIAIESYANELLKKKDGLYEQFDARKNLWEKKFSKLIELLVSEEIISAGKAEVLTLGFTKISKMRNDIAHGKVEDIRISRQNATDAYELVKSAMTEYLMEYYQNQKPAFRIVKVQKTNK